MRQREEPTDSASRPGITVPLVARPRTMGAVGVAAVLSLVLQHGFLLRERFDAWFNAVDVLLAVGFIAGLAVRLATAKRPREAFRRRRFEAMILAVFLPALLLLAVLPHEPLSTLLLVFHQETRAELLIGLVKLFLLGNVCIQALRTLQRIFVAGVRLELVLAGSFAALILIGTLLLLMPGAAAKPGAPLSLLDAFFTAVSAVCVTGLVVRDTGADFSTLGQMIILALIQIGGLGIVTFVAFISAFSAKTLPVPQMVAFRQMINAPAIGDLKRRIAGILLLTGLIEGAGMAALYGASPAGGDTFERLKWGAFHSVSAFCNAGFAFSPSSLEFARKDPAVNGIIMLLIVLGSLGFLVLPELIAQGAAALRQLPMRIHASRRRFLPGRPRLTLQTRISLRVTLWLTIAGFAGFWLLESGNVLRGAGAGESALVSLFQSITCRTAGFNTVPLSDLGQATLMLMILLMVVGGCPVSTAGGIKTVTLGVLFLALRSMMSRREKVEAHGRTLPARAFFTALNVSVLYAATAATAVFLLSVFDPQLALRDTLFETISALSTVGLSTGITAGLSVPSKIVLCLTMFIGRVGPIALVFSVFQARGRVDYEFPVEDVVVS